MTRFWQSDSSNLDAHRITFPLVEEPPLVSWIDTIPVKSSDKPCTIGSLDLDAHVCGLYAKVTETLTIENPNKRPLSAAIAIPLPDRAVVCGYALDIGGQMVDGVAVPKDEARITFEKERRRGIDPGLVEAVKGNVYQTRVYPVPARGKRTVRLSFVAPLLLGGGQSLPGGGQSLLDGGQSATLDLPMPGEPLEQRAVRIDVDMLGCPAPQLSGLGDKRFQEAHALWSVESHERGLTPHANIRVALPALPARLVSLERDEEGTVWFSASEAAPAAKPTSRTAQSSGSALADTPAITSLTVLWDVSGSHAGVDHAEELAVLRRYGSEAIRSYRLITFGDTTDETRSFESIDELAECVAGLRYDGGTDFAALSQALARLDAASPASASSAAESGVTPKPGVACVLFTDGLDTLSDEPLTFPEGWDVLAIIAGTERDSETLRQACAGRVFDVAAAPKDAVALARALFDCDRLTAVTGEGASDIIGIGSGGDGRYAVIGKLTVPKTTLRFENTGTEFVLDAADAHPGDTLARAWAAMRVAQLSLRANDNADELLQLGRRFGVVSPTTSLLVLESLDQWLRYDIEPPKAQNEMHRQWVQARKGHMRNTSDAQVKNDHVHHLTEAWRDVLSWWAGDKPRDRYMPDFRDSDGYDLREEWIANDMSIAAPDADDLREEYLGGDVHELRSCMSMPTAAPVCASVALTNSVSTTAATPAGSDPATATATVNVQPWMPDAPYLDAIDAAFAAGTSAVAANAEAAASSPTATVAVASALSAAHDAYFAQRTDHVLSPSFYLDCAGWFLAHDDKAFGLRVLSNLAELRIQNAALLRVMAWRLREAGELERALVTLRRVLKLRKEDSQSHRDVALVLDELARKAYAEGDRAHAKMLAEEAGAYYRETALTPWERHPLTIGLFAVEEYNVLRAWANERDWTDAAPELPSLGKGLEGVPDCDLRVTLAWDADETDVDLHVTEPSGEEAYFANRFTYSGGRMSDDITDGFGPELYETRKAQTGTYDIRAHYYASHQQTVFGPTTCTLTVYTDWGRASQTQRITSTRLDDEREMVSVGTASYGVKDDTL